MLNRFGTLEYLVSFVMLCIHKMCMLCSCWCFVIEYAELRIKMFTFATNIDPMILNRQILHFQLESSYFAQVECYQR